MQYELVAEAYRDLEQVTGRLALIERLAALLAQTPAALLPQVCYLCQAQVAPEFADVELGVAERLAAPAVATATGASAAQVLAAPAVATATGASAAQVLAALQATGDLGQAAEQLLA